MADATSPGMLPAGLLPMLVGAAIALAGTWLGSWISDRRKEKAERQKKRAEKFEELVAAVFEFDHWVDNARQAFAFGKEAPDLVSPFRKIHAISATYFPEFESAIQELDNETSRYRIWMTEAGQKRLAGQADVTQGFKEAYTRYQQKRDEFLRTLKDFAAGAFH